MYAGIRLQERNVIHSLKQVTDKKGILHTSMKSTCGIQINSKRRPGTLALIRYKVMWNQRLLVIWQLARTLLIIEYNIISGRSIIWSDKQVTMQL